MDLKEALSKLQRNKDFLKWKGKNKNTFLSYAFKIPEEMGYDNWQIGFYNKRKDKITTFIMESENVRINPAQEVFKKNSIKVNEIDIS